MAKLVHCKMCGKIVAEHARKCPYCGEGNPAFTNKIARNFLILFVFTLIVFSLVIPKNAEKSQWNEQVNLQASTIEEKK